MAVPTTIPASFTEFYRDYYSYVVRLVNRAGVPYQEAEDISQTILTRFYERGVLEQYDPNREQGAKFSTFVSSFVLIYVRHYRNRLLRLNAHELDLLDRPVSSTDDLKSAWADAHGYTHEDSYEELELSTLKNSIEERLSRVVKNDDRSACDLLKLFRMISDQVEEDGKHNTQVIADEFGVSVSTIKYWIAKLRVYVSAVTS